MRFSAKTMAMFATFLSTAALAQAPGQPIRIIYPFAAGGSADGVVRIIADRLHAHLSQPVVVENRTGGSGQIGINFVKNAPPDGLTILLSPFAPMTLYPSTYKKLDFDPATDFRPVSQLVTYDFGLSVGQSVPAKTAKELAAWLKENPAKADFGSPGAGALPHFIGIRFGQAVGVVMNHIPYRGTPLAITDLISGQIPMISAGVGDMFSLHREGKIRIIATSGKERSIEVADVPTFREQEYDISGSGWMGMYLPAGASDEVVNRLNAAALEILRAPEVKSQLASLGYRATGTSPSELAAVQKLDREQWAPVVKASGFIAD